MASVSRNNLKAILGKKIGMTQIFTEDGSVVPVTVLQAGPCSILQIRTEEKDGYTAYQLGFDRRNKKANKPEQGQFDRAGSETKHHLREVPFIDAADLITASAEPSADSSSSSSAEEEVGEGGANDGDDEAVESVVEGAEIRLGAEIGVGVFKKTKSVDVQGLIKGRGFAGTIKRHGFQRGDAGHGSKNTREPGSTGQHTDPGRVFKGKRMAGHYGNSMRKAINLEIVQRDEDKNLLLVRGSVPGPNGGYVYIEESLKQ